MSMGVFFGGIAQIIAGILEWRRANGFGALAFISYGSFWLTLIFIWVAPHTGLTSADPVSMGWYLTMWGLFTTVLFLCTLKGNTIGKCIFLGRLSFCFSCWRLPISWKAISFIPLPAMWGYCVEALLFMRPLRLF